MNIKPNAITILCYGDSNTWGQKPDKSGRYPANIRWTGALQQSLGDNYYIIEEGLSSRTTDLEYSRKPGRNGKTYLTPCIASHNPLDFVIVMLGTNDLKIEFDRSAAQIATAISRLVEDIKNNAWNKQKSIPEIIVVSPILIDDLAPDFKNFYSENYDDESALKSQRLASELVNIAKNSDCHFLDAATVSRSDSDGVHFDEASHPALGKLIANYIEQIKF
jgi:lysophospholipase L1-like esterase